MSPRPTASLILFMRVMAMAMVWYMASLQLNGLGWTTDIQRSGTNNFQPRMSNQELINPGERRVESRIKRPFQQTDLQALQPLFGQPHSTFTPDLRQLCCRVLHIQFICQSQEPHCRTTTFDRTTCRMKVFHLSYLTTNLTTASQAETRQFLFQPENESHLLRNV